MQLILKSVGANSKFVSWLKGFKDIDNVLLIEVDIHDKKFVSKGFPDTRSIVKYDEISFENAGYELESLIDNEEKSMLSAKKTLLAAYKNNFKDDDRIKVGLYNILNKFIDVESMYSSVEHTLTLQFDESNNVKYSGSNESVKQWQGEKLTLQSKSLSMTVKCSTLSDFFVFLKDTTFTTISNIDTPMHFTVTPETIANLNRVSLLFSSDKQRSNVKLYTKKVDDNWNLYAFDATNKSYDYLLSIADGSLEYVETELFILRENFITAAKSLDTDMVLSMSEVDPQKLLIETTTSKTLVAAQQMH
jgi:hypothetical protein